VGKVGVGGGVVGVKIVVGFLDVGFTVPPVGPIQIPLLQVPKGIELQGVASGKYCPDEGQLPSELQDTVFSQSLPMLHRQSGFDASL